MTNNSGVFILLALILAIAHSQLLMPLCNNDVRVITTNGGLALSAVLQLNNVLYVLFRPQLQLIILTSLFVRM